MMMERKSFFLFLVLGISQIANSQKVLLHRRLSSVLQRNEDAQTMANAGKWLYTRTTSLGSVLPPLEYGDIEIHYPGCFFLGNDHRFSRPLRPHLSFGWGLGFQLLTYGIRQQTDNALSNHVVYKRQNLTSYTLPVEFFIRQHLKKRSRDLGWYVDAGWKGGWNFYQVLLNQEELDPKLNQGVGRRYSYNSRLDYLNRWTQYITLRWGSGHFGVSALYRLSHFFQPSESIYYGRRLPDMPKFIGAIEFTFWNRNKSGKKDEDEM